MLLCVRFGKKHLSGINFSVVFPHQTDDVLYVVFSLHLEGIFVFCILLIKLITIAQYRCSYLIVVQCCVTAKGNDITENNPLIAALTHHTQEISEREGTHRPPW